MSRRPASARGRLVREPVQAAPLVHGGTQPPPDAEGVAGPGHFRHFVNSVSQKHQLKDPLRTGEEHRDCEFYSMSQKQPGPGRESSSMRTLDISKVNKERHKWQRIDTFQTPWGNGQAYYDGAGASGRARTASREGPGAQTQALAMLGLEVEQLRDDIRAAMAETREELSQTIAMAVNQTVAELRQDVRAETAAVRQQMLIYEEARNAEYDAAEPVASSVPLQPQPQQMQMQHMEPVQQPNFVQDELRSLRLAVEASTEAMLNELRRARPEDFDAAQELRVLDVKLQAVLTPMQEVGARLDRLDAGQLVQLEQVHSRLDRLDQNQAALVDKMDHATVRQITDLQATSRLLDEAVRAVAEAQKEARREVQAPHFGQEDPELLREIQALQLSSQQNFRLLRDSLEANAERRPELARAEGPEVLALGELRAAVAELKARLPDREKDRERLPDRSIELEQLLAGQRDMKQTLADLAGSAPKHSGVQKIDLSVVTAGLQGLHEDQLGLRELLRQNQTDLSPVLIGMEQVRKALAAMSQEVEISREVVVKRGDVTALSQTMQNAWELLNQTKAALNKVDFGYLQADVQRVLEELRETRAELPKLARSLEPKEVDFTPVLRAVQDGKRVHEEFGEKLVEEVHRLRRECDFSQIIQQLEQVEPALRQLRSSVREGRDLDLSPVLEEVHRVQSALSSELRQSRPTRELLQLQEELAAVKAATREGPDLSPILGALRAQERQGDGRDEGRETVLSEFRDGWREMKDLLRKLEGKGGSSDGESLRAATQELRVVAATITDMVRGEVSKVDMEPLVREIQLVKSKVEVSSALKRQSEHMTKSDFATALEELRGHFSLLLSSFREVCNNSTGVSATAVNTLLQNLLEQRQRENESTAEDLDYLRRKLRDTQSVIGQAGTRHEELRRATGSARPPERADQIHEPVAVEPVTPGVVSLPLRR